MINGKSYFNEVLRISPFLANGDLAIGKFSFFERVPYNQFILPPFKTEENGIFRAKAHECMVRRRMIVLRISVHTHLRFVWEIIINLFCKAQITARPLKVLSLYLKGVSKALEIQFLDEMAIIQISGNSGTSRQLQNFKTPINMGAGGRGPWCQSQGRGAGAGDL